MLHSKKLFFTIIVIGCSIFNQTAKATQSGQTNLRLHGTIQVIECTINNGVDKEVSFGGAVGTHRIDGIRYKQSIPFEVACTNAEDSEISQLKLTIEGEKTTFDSAAVKTNIDGFGIQFQQNEKPIELNKSFYFKYNSIPNLTAVPVKDKNAELDAADFYASVKLIVEVA
ncbi:fimbrial protein [Klebsiella aerogenes]|uniref:fimbrial protein n=1 Tax=Klebsiella aerogenes TaxID=548 RepID=UPI001905C234|nr:fimbrial protein [Klebsiella aerogenes]MBK0469656.1 fimbrial protein [Klebsiella aerogenes]